MIKNFLKRIKFLNPLFFARRNVAQSHSFQMPKVTRQRQRRKRMVDEIIHVWTTRNNEKEWLVSLRNNPTKTWISAKMANFLILKQECEPLYEIESVGCAWRWNDEPPCRVVTWKGFSATTVEDCNKIQDSLCWSLSHLPVSQL